MNTRQQRKRISSARILEHRANRQIWNKRQEGEKTQMVTRQKIIGIINQMKRLRNAIVRVILGLGFFIASNSAHKEKPFFSLIHHLFAHLFSAWESEIVRRDINSQMTKAWSFVSSWDYESICKSPRRVNGALRCHGTTKVTKLSFPLAFCRFVSRAREGGEISFALSSHFQGINFCREANSWSKKGSRAIFATNSVTMTNNFIMLTSLDWVDVGGIEWKGLRFGNGWLTNISYACPDSWRSSKQSLFWVTYKNTQSGFMIIKI